MTLSYIDTDVIIRLLTNDDSAKQAQAAALFEQVEKGLLMLAAPDTVIVDAVFVLSSPKLYHLPRQEVAALLLSLVRLPNFRIENRRVVLSALAIYAMTPKLDFGDAMIVAAMQESGVSTVYSYDAHFDRIAGIVRQQPR
jgi:predicted nucleic acid-binding protein